jgi:2-phosphoglycerate kinase
MAGIVIGGSSCVGKSTVAAQLQVQLAVPHVNSDRSLPKTREIQPLAGPIEIWDRPVPELRDMLVAAAHAATPYLVEQAEGLSNGNASWILEGERVHPELVERLQADALADGVFVVETSAARLHQTLLARLAGFQSLSEARQKAVAELDRQYNLWLLAEARHRGLRIVASQPWDTLAARVMSAIEGARGRPTRS